MTRRAAALFAFCAVAIPVPAAHAQSPPPDFTETTVATGLDFPTALRFAPGGRLFVAEKSGLIKTFDSITDPSPTVVADLRTEVLNYYDRGLLGIELDPDFATNRHLYALYTRNAKIGGAAPFWPELDASNDDCPGPTDPPTAAAPGPLTDGCVASAKLVRLKLSPAFDSVLNSHTVIQDEWCQQFPSHSIGSMAFDRDGNLFVSAGDAALFGDSDWGQHGIPLNPCGDPPGGVGAVLTDPTAEGGVLRSQDLRTTGDPTTLDGAVIRIDPATGDPATGNPLTGPDLNARRIVAHGFRNPFRIAVRPGTDELWIGDVGWGQWEEINRLPPIAAGVMPNYGWPCYQNGDGIYGMLSVCQDLFAEGLGAINLPVFAYPHLQPAIPGDACGNGENGSSISGLAFEDSSPFPAPYRNALFFGDYSRGCIWVMRDTNGDSVPDGSAVEGFRPGASGPVDLQFGPGGSLYYVDIIAGAIHQITWEGPAPSASAAPESGEAPLPVILSGAGTTDPNDLPVTLQYDWDLDGDGAFDDASGLIVPNIYTAQGSYVARLRVTDPDGNVAVDSVTINVSNGPPAPEITAADPDPWRAGETIAFAGEATDPEEGELDEDQLDWQVDIRHCPQACHTHPWVGLAGADSGSLVAPPHEWPSHLVLTLTATDSFNREASVSRELHPRTSVITVTTSPPGLGVTYDLDTDHPTPMSRTEIVGSVHRIGAEPAHPDPLGDWLWQSWSDGGAITHNVVAADDNATFTAAFAREPGAGPPNPPTPPPPTSERTCAGVPATQVGTNGDETISGTRGADSIVARGGDDLVRTGRGKDMVCGGGGADVLLGGRGADRLRGGPGSDRCGGSGADKRRSCRGPS